MLKLDTVGDLDTRPARAGQEAETVQGACSRGDVSAPKVTTSSLARASLPARKAVAHCSLSVPLLVN